LDEIRFKIVEARHPSNRTSLRSGGENSSRIAGGRVAVPILKYRASGVLKKSPHTASQQSDHANKS
jgi:hypothetical protein